MPHHLRRAIAEFLQNIDLSTGRFGTAYQDKLDHLQKVYAEIIGDSEDNPAIEYDPDLLNNIDAAKAFANKRLIDLKGDELETLYRLVQAVNQSVNNANRLVAHSRYGTIEESAERLAYESRLRKARYDYGGLLGPIVNVAKNWYDYKAADPNSFFMIAGDEMYDIFKAIRNGRNISTEHLKEAAV